MGQRQKQIYRISLLVVLAIVLFAIAALYLARMKEHVPDEIMIYENRAEELNLRIPFSQMKLSGDEMKAVQVSVNGSPKLGKDLQLNLSKPISVFAENSGSLLAEVKLWGWLHYKNIRIDIRKPARVMPVGKAVGLYIHADGVMVLGTGKVAGKNSSPAYEKLQTGDYICAVNGIKVRTIQDISHIIRKEGGKKLILNVTRGANHIKISITPIRSSGGDYQIGAWLREDTEGIGTLTFVTEDNQFAALGHGITDADTELLIRLQNGGLYPARIDHIEKGKKGAPGQLAGSVQLGSNARLGTIQDNTPLGITGEITAEQYRYRSDHAYPIGRKQEVRQGEAKILCQLGDEVEEYRIEIERINFSSEDNKGMAIHVTDPKLLEKAGGIVQGMRVSYNRDNTGNTDK